MNPIRLRQTEPSSPTVSSGARSLGARVRELRQARGWTLEAAAQKTGVSRASLSKIEHDQMSPTFDALQKLASGFGIDLTELVANRRNPAAAGRRSITRAGQGQVHETETYRHELLAAELARKAMLPFRTVIRARTLDDYPDWDRHDSEDLLYVLEGSLTLYTEFYEPVVLNPGDSVYMDCRMGHACVSNSETDAVILWVSTG
ncbi:MAG: XRE family transcriptional regulator [Alphaproteobacteria bacterium]|nr:XRE family transcriptional regulator [Alphaproteobacteria bacterium]